MAIIDAMPVEGIPDTVPSPAEQAAVFDLAHTISADELEALTEGRESSFTEFMRTYVGPLNADGDAELPPVFMSHYGSGLRTSAFEDVVFTGFDAEEGVAVHIRKYTRTSSDQTKDYFSAALWDAKKDFIDRITVWHDADKIPGNMFPDVSEGGFAAVLEYGPDKYVIKMLKDPEDGQFKTFYLGKKFTNRDEEWRNFGDTPMRPIHILTEQVESLRSATEKVSAGSGGLATVRTLFP